MLANFGFGKKWISWIQECVSTARISILVNGSPTKEFNPQKGLKQGDPLSLFLFNLVVEALNILFQRAMDLRLLKGVSVGANDEVQLSHLQFADNSLLFCEAELTEVLNLKRILRCFEVSSGLKINYHKSVVCGIGISGSSLVEFASLLNCKTQNLPIKYLGLPLGANPRRKKTWKPAVDKVKLSKYRFLGGKWVPNPSLNTSSSYIWNGIVAVGEQNQSLSLYYASNLQLKVGNGCHIRFWFDSWCGNICLKDEFPRHFSLSLQKEGLLKDFVEVSGTTKNWLFTFRRPLFVWEKNELLRLNGIVGSVPSFQLESKDSAVWRATKPGQSFMSNLYNHTSSAYGGTVSLSHLVWIKFLPPKVQFFGWLTWKHKIKTSVFLQRIGVLDSSVSTLKKRKKKLCEDIIARLKSMHETSTEPSASTFASSSSANEDDYAVEDDIVKHA
ncbi:uncharacterized protein LOC114272902 [Camellia sinensis]|uniref:uncharacterized protein LOC114272902 n=1 Tax=Camellia sinensis TaxID=4442 RepID=UPI001036D3C0|nr:uncharacterized protein LOC114272902 [Camellia sinensis]